MSSIYKALRPHSTGYFERTRHIFRYVAARASLTVQAAIPLAHRPISRRHVPPQTDPTWLGNAFAFRGSVQILHPFPAAQPADVRRTLSMSINAKAALSTSTAKLSTYYTQLL
jgi:hypothetical protein